MGAVFMEAADLTTEAFAELTRRTAQQATLSDPLNFLFDAFRKTIPYSRVGIALIDNEGLVVLKWARSNLPMENLPVGYTAPLVGSSLEGILASAKPRVISDYKDYLRAKPSSESTRRALRDGVRSSLTCPLGSPRKPVGFVFFSSEKPHAYDSLHVDIFQLIACHVSIIVDRSAKETELKLHAKDDHFLSQVMHDLKNPLGVIHGYADLILSGGCGDVSVELAQAVQTVARQTDRLGKLVADVQDLSVLGAQHFSLRKSTVSLKTFFSEFLATAQIPARKKGIRISLSLESSLPVETRFDVDRIDQVLANLIGNALKYSEPGTSITFKAESRDQNLVVSISDQGPGIPKEDIPKLFNPFSRSTARTTGGEESTGLGLYICRQIIEAHGGKIWVESEGGRGSTFVFSLPL